VVLFCVYLFLLFVLYWLQLFYMMCIQKLKNNLKERLLLTNFSKNNGIQQDVKLKMLATANIVTN